MTLWKEGKSGGEIGMYHFSRAIYRELAPYVSHEAPLGRDPSNQAQVLAACEAAIRRLATDRHYFAHPTRSLFREIRMYFPLAEQYRVYLVVDRYITFAKAFFAAQPNVGYDMLGNRMECRATTRKGRPCQRMPLPHNGYCPSHQHLADSPLPPTDPPLPQFHIAA